MQTRGILLNYEGTIDTNGQHWGAILWHKFQRHIIGLDKSVFNRAYAYSEDALAAKDVIQPSDVFLDVLTQKINRQFDYLIGHGYSLDYSLVNTMAKECNELVARTLRKTRDILEGLSSNFPIVLVSNFYGNLNAVLAEFEVRQYFADVIETTNTIPHLNTEIYEQGVKRLGYAPEECVAVGDSYNRDILPSKEIGCKTVWLNVMGWEEWGIDELEISDAEIGDFSQLPQLLERWEPTALDHYR
ncbi:HAD family hydrolase [Parapedobacter deserti]|uniref:HAD family hydrolase n=1 Tax=Parapedobacter deserti TaxID=1912957 RepID=A0ABV7JMP3_9SPHI